MIKKTELTTTLKIQCKPDGSDEQLCVIFHKEAGTETIQLGDSFEDAAESKKYSFKDIAEIVQNILGSLPPDIPVLKTPKIKDHRREPLTGVIDDNQKDPTIEFAQSVQNAADDIQKKVDESMNNIDHEESNYVSLTAQSEQKVIDAGPELDLLAPADEDPIGISVEELSRFGPIPETPKKFKNELQKIAAERAKTPIKKPEKKIKRKEE